MYIILAIIAFGILILVHEFGHFAVAKLNGVKVEEFAIGMGPKLFSIKGKETVYSINLFPVGGYTKMLGENEDVTGERSFSSKSPLRKLSIIIAGPIMNLILGVLLFGIIASSKGYLTPVIDKVVANQPAAIAGLTHGDKILEINKQKILTWDDCITVIYMSKGNPLSIKYQRNNTLNTVNIIPVKEASDNRFIVGIYPTQVTSPNISQAISYGFIETGSLIKQTFKFFGTLFTGGASMNDFGGPVTIIKVSGAAAKAGIISLMAFGAYISIQLAIFNIIPFPALDGGYIILYLFEIITGKRVDEHKVGAINNIGFALLITMMILVTVKDIMYPIKF